MKALNSQRDAEWQLATSVEHHVEAITATQVRGRSDASQHAAVKSVGRAVHLDHLHDPSDATWRPWRHGPRNHEIVEGSGS